MEPSGPVRFSESALVVLVAVVLVIPNHVKEVGVQLVNLRCVQKTLNPKP